MIAIPIAIGRSAMHRKPAAQAMSLIGLTWKIATEKQTPMPTPSRAIQRIW